jgi:ferredoxin/coenzyme F420-reducing hydrogenase delta subunit
MRASVLAEPKVGPDATLPRQDPARPEPPVLGEGVLRAVERGFLWAERQVGRALPDKLNPLVNTGALAVVTFLIASVTGVLVLIWYRSSVHGAYASVVEMGQSPYLAGLVRSLHRYSSDACMLFVVLHAARLFVARRFGGARKLAWVTGIILIIALWAVGWLGYWLVWDERAQLVALGTAKMMDVLPIFADPLSRSFLADEHVNSLLFFVVFFMHMLLPLGMAIPLWLHITRLSRARFLTRLPLTLVTLGALCILSLLLPADVAGPAKLTRIPGQFTLDAFYLLPLWFTDRLGPGALWALFVGVSVVLLGVPWWMQRRRAVVAHVKTEQCNACTLCVQDCPYDAITMVPRTDGRGFEAQALVDPAKCVGCGICAGSCDPGAIGLPGLPVMDTRRALEAKIERSLGRGEAPMLALCCTSSAGEALRPDLQGRSAALPGYVVVEVPCAGWVHALTVERAVKKGAQGVLVVGCGPGECTYREGMAWVGERLAGARPPALRSDQVDSARVCMVQTDRGDLKGLRLQAQSFREKTLGPRAPRPAARWAVAAAALLVAMGATWWGSQISYAGPPLEPGLVVSFKHPGQVGEKCRELSAQEQAAQPIHMRQTKICDRARADVRLRIEVDGKQVLDAAHIPAGVSRDGNSVAVERVPLPPGRHHISVALDEGAGDFPFRSSREVTVPADGRVVVLFDRVNGFGWYGDEG